MVNIKFLELPKEVQSLTCLTTNEINIVRPIQLIFDNHSFNPAVNTDPGIENILIPVWQQMAEHYKNRSNLIF